MEEELSMTLYFNLPTENFLLVELDTVELGATMVSTVLRPLPIKSHIYNVAAGLTPPIVTHHIKRKLDF